MRPSLLLLLCALFGAFASHAAEITHGPILGRLGSDEIGVWARTARPGEFRVHYGTQPTDLDQVSEPVRTALESDLTAWVHIQGLQPDTVYYYRLEGESGARSHEDLQGDFRTLPSADSKRHPVHNPEGLFNFSFEYGCGNNQQQDASLPAFHTMLREIEDRIDFAILDGDWLYEEQREFTPAQWREQTGAPRTPRILDIAPTIAGVWENYKLYLSRGTNLAAWHREVPSFFMFDDHEMLNDMNGTGTPGLRNRRAAFRDIGLEAWQKYLGWANPVDWEQDILFGRTSLKAGSDVLVDPSADFRELDLSQAGTLTVHWGEPTAGVNDVRLDAQGGDPNAGVYRVEEKLDRNRLRISPAPKADSEVSYSVGRFLHFRKRVANTEFFFVDTRSHRMMHDIRNPYDPAISVLGAAQKQWLKDAMSSSDAEFMFVVSSVNLMIPHVLPGQEKKNKDEAWTSVAAERKELIDFWDSLGKPVLVLTGDLHNSFAIQITDNVWEFASGPHNSGNHDLNAEAARPSNGPYESRGRQADIHWSTFFPSDLKGPRRRPVYAVIQVNNVFRVNDGPMTDVWAAYKRSHLVVQYYDGLNGDLLYAESIQGR